MASAIVKAGKPAVVLPLNLEFVRNEDEKEKQDRERNSAKRWVNTHNERYSPLKITILEDDLCADTVARESPDIQKIILVI
jgi:hypothetical protein